MTKCNIANMGEAQLAAQKMLAVATDLFETMHSGNMTAETVQ